MDYTVTHPSSGNCTDLPNQGNYSNRQDNARVRRIIIMELLIRNLKGLKEL